MDRKSLRTSTALVALSAGAGTSAGNAGDSGTQPANTAAAAPAKVKLSRAKAHALAIKLLAKTTGQDPAALAQQFAPKPAAAADGGNPQDPTAARDAGIVALERRRKSDLESLAQIYKLDDSFVTLAVGKGWDIPTARTEALKKLEEKSRPLNVSVGVDANLVNLSGSMKTAIRLRAGAKVEVPKEAAELAVYERAVKMRGLSIVDMGRKYLSAIGYGDAYEIGKSRVIALCVNPRELRQQPGGGQMVMLAESIGDFTGILKDAINKSLLQAYRDASPSWQKWCRRATNPDFKVINRAALSESPDLKSRNQGKGIDYVNLSDTNETYALAEYTNGIKLTRQALINDDLDAFARIPMLQGNAAARKEDDVAYGILTANANMVQDSTALFHANHKNLLASGAAPSVTELAKAYQLMRVQKGPAGAARLNIQPKFVLCPVALEVATMQLVNSTQLLAVISTSSSAPQTVGSSNPWANRLEVISNPRLDDASAVVWYLSAFYGDGQVDTVEVCFLEDEPEPVLKQETDFDTDDQKFAVRHTVAAKAIDFRGLVKDAGQ
jgi:hypothetical protein